MRTVLALAAIAALGAVLAPEALAGAGTLDPLFGGDGRVLGSLGGADSQGSGVVRDARGRLLVAGWATGPGGHDFALARYHRNGRLDRGFGDGGVVRTDLGRDDFARAVALDSEGRIVVAGNSEGRALASTAAVVRYLPDGRLDPSFGGGDGTVLPPSAVAFAALGLALDRDGRIVIAGGPNAFVARLTPSGELDSSFSEDGVARLAPYSHAYGLALDPAGRPLVALCEQSADDLHDRAAVARLGNDGNPDGFGGDGVVELDFGGGSACGRAVAFDRRAARGRGTAYRVVVAGDRARPNRILVARLNRAGRLDLSFSEDGTTAFRFRGGEVSVAAVATQNRDILLGGSFDPAHRGRPKAFALARLAPSGRFDRSFGGDGKVLTAFGARQRFAGVRGLLVDAKNTTAVGFAARSLDPFEPRSFLAMARYGAPTCFGAGATIRGGGDSERLVGTGRRDVIVGFGGNDRVFGRGGNDLICGGRGADRIWGNAGNDRLNGGPGRDVLHGGPGRDVIHQGATGLPRAFYKASRPGVTVLIGTVGNRIQTLRISVRQHCTDERLREFNFRTDRFNLRFDPRTGFFHWRNRVLADVLNEESRLRGTVHEHLVTGRLFDEYFYAPGGFRPSYSCWTGRSRGNPWVEFRARRL